MTTFPVQESFLQHFWEVALQVCPSFRVTASWYRRSFCKLFLNEMEQAWGFTGWERAGIMGSILDWEPRNQGSLV